METFLRDIRYGIRTMRNSGTALVAVLTLGLGVGVNTVVFSVVNAVVLRPLPVRGGERLTVLATERSSVTGLHGVSFPDLQDYRRATADVFEGVAGYTVGFVGLTSQDGRAERVLATWVTGTYFPLLDLRPALGRMIRASEGDPGQVDPVGILGYSTWRRRFGGNPSVVGRPVKVNGRPVTIIGVAPPGFTGTFAFANSELYLPVNWAGKATLERRDVRSFHALARLRPGKTIAQAQAAIDVVAARLERQFPATNKGIAARVLAERLARPEEENARTNSAVMAIMTVLVGLVLVVAAVNVTNLLLARAVTRQREIAIRSALGAGRWRILQQLLAESLLLAAAAGVAGALLGGWAGNLIAGAKLPGDLPVWFDFHLDWRVLAYTAILALTAGILAGVPPALRATRTDLEEVLRGGFHGFVLSGRHWVSGLLIAAQIAVCLVLLTSGGLFMRSLARAQSADLGFDPRGVLNVHMDVDQIGFTEAQGRVFFRDLEERVRAIPTVESTSLAFTIPMGYVYTSQTIDLAGRLAPVQERLTAGMNAVSTGYFATVRIPIIRGRSFTDRDNQRTSPVAVVNERFAQALWPGRDPLGRRFSFNGPEGPWAEVVGVTRTGKYHLLFEDPQPYFYVPIDQFYTGLRVLQVRTSASPETLIPSIERIVRAREPDLVMFDTQSMTRALDGGYGLFLVRVAAWFAAVFGVLALVLSAVGLCGVVSFAARERTHEAGIRMALGAAPRDVVRLALRQAMMPVAAGIGLGLLGVMATGRVASRFLFGTEPNDPLVLLGGTLFLVIVALGASYVPARRIGQVDPMTALRHE